MCVLMIMSNQDKSSVQMLHVSYHTRGTLPHCDSNDAVAFLTVLVCQTSGSKKNLDYLT